MTAPPEISAATAQESPVSGQEVLTERRGPVVVVTINRPEAGNAVNAAVTAGLDAALGAAAADPTVAAVILTGAGERIFCAGMDLKFFADHGTGSLVTDTGGFAGVVKRDIDKPLIAAVNGAALAGGFEMVLACDFVVAAEHATFGLPEVKRGLIAAAGGLARLPGRVPRGLALELVLTGGVISACDAQRAGLVNHVVAGADVVDHAFGIAEAIAANAPLAVRASRRLVRSLDDASPDEVWRRSERELGQLFGTDDVREGARAFREKRSPRWAGR